MGEKPKEKILLIEPFYGGSHKQLIDILLQYLIQPSASIDIDLYKLPAKKWHWRARTSALYFSQTIPENKSYKILFCSSVLNLTELIGLRQDLSSLLKIIYFHENQLVYPVKKYKDRDFQYGYNQILSALSADTVIFNSNYNLNSFLQNIDSHLNMQPDFRLKGLKDRILSKSKVIYFPLVIPVCNVFVTKTDILHIIWPHRWEHDKNPELFFEVLFKLKENNHKFVVSVLGENFSQMPEIFMKARAKLDNSVLNWGRLELKTDYFKCLQSGHVAVSTANHEFFGVAMLEAVSCGCFPIVCNKLVYPEIYPKICLYNTSQQLYKKLRNLCEKPYLSGVYLKQANIDLKKFSVDSIMKQFGDVMFVN